MAKGLEEQVRRRAKGRCEYCLAPESASSLKFVLDHVIARQHSGRTAAANLALSCMHCNLHKGPNIAGVDPETGKVVQLFHPRRDRWSEHFRWSGWMLTGITDVGRATIHVLAMNSFEQIKLRMTLTG